MEGWVDPRMIAGMQAGQIDPIKYHSLRYLMLFCWELSTPSEPEINAENLVEAPGIIPWNLGTDKDGRKFNIGISLLLLTSIEKV